MTQVEKPIPSTRKAVLSMIEKFLKDFPEFSASSFGWKATGDFALVKNMRDGKDILTGKMDKIIQFIKEHRISTQQQKEGLNDEQQTCQP